MVRTMFPPDLAQGKHAMVVGGSDDPWWVREATKKRERQSSLFFLLPFCGFLPLTPVWKPILFA